MRGCAVRYARVFAVLMLFSAMLFAALPASAGKRKAVKVGNKKTVIDFTAITIDGKVKRPMGAFILERKDKTFSKLLDINESFLDLIVKGADEF